VVILTLSVVFLHGNTPRNPFMISRGWWLFVCSTSPFRLLVFPYTFVFSKANSPANFSRIGVCRGWGPRNVLELETMRGVEFSKGFPIP